MSDMSRAGVNLVLMMIFILCDVRDIFHSEMWSYRKVCQSPGQENARRLKIGNPPKPSHGQSRLFSLCDEMLVEQALDFYNSIFSKQLFQERIYSLLFCSEHWSEKYNKFFFFIILFKFLRLPLCTSHNSHSHKNNSFFLM